MKNELKCVQIMQEHVIQAPRAKVFEALTKDIHHWWSHSVSDEPKEIRLEAKLGGLFFEDFGNGGGAIFATVTWLKPGEEIELRGSMGLAGTVEGCFGFTLEEKGKSTLVRLEHQFFGPFSDQAGGMYEEGWKELLGPDHRRVWLIHEARQYLWDDVRGGWTLIDWE